MADSVSTFRAVCRGGLNTGADVLSLGEESPGSAIQLLNYEPNLEGGYRRLTGFANNFGTVPGTGSVLGVAVANGVNQGVLACRTPSSGSNYLHHWNFYYTVAVTSGDGSSFTVGETVTAVESSSDSTSTGVSGTVIAKASASLTINFGRLPTSVFATNNVLTGGTSSSTTTVTSTPTVIGWTEVTCDLIANDRDGVSASASISAGNNAVIGGALADSGAVNFVTAASEQPRQVTIFGGSDESGRTFTITGTSSKDNAIVEAVTGPNNSTVSSSRFFKTVTSVSVSIPVQVIVKAAGDESDRTFTVTGTNDVDETIEEEITGPNASTATSSKSFKTITQIAVDAATAGAIEVGTSADDNGICASQTPSGAGNLTINGALASSGAVSTAAATVGAIEIGSGTGEFRPANPTMTGVSKVRFTDLNFGTPKVILTDGINPAAIFDGTTYQQITDSNAPTTPKIATEFQKHVFLAGDSSQPSSLFISAPEAPTDFSPANGALVLNVGFSIVALKRFRNVLFIFGKNNIKRLVGDNSANFVLESVTSNLGCLSTDSVIELGGDLLFLAPDGIRPIGGTNKIGDVNLETVSKTIQSTIRNVINAEDLDTLSSVIIRSKSQFRYMFSTSSSQGILGALREYQGNIGFEFAQTFGLECTCADSGYIEQEEFVLHGSSSGKVFQQESGNSFDTSNILSIFKTPFVYMGNPEQRKTFYSTSAYMSAEGNFSVALSVTYDYDNTDIATPDNLTLSTTSPGAFFDRGTNVAVFDTTDIFDGNPSPVESVTFSGSGKAIALTFVTDDTNESHSIQGFTITHGLGDVR